MALKLLRIMHLVFYLSRNSSTDPADEPFKLNRTMAKRLKETILKLVLRRFLPRKCPRLIPRTGDSAKKVNCWSTAILRDGEPYFKPSEINGNQIAGRLFSEGEFSTPEEIDIHAVVDEEWTFFHYFGETTITFGSVWAVLRNRLFGFIYARILLVRLWDYIARLLFNFRSLPEESRKAVIETVIEIDLSKSERSFSGLEVLGELYSLRVFLHPDYERMERMVARKLQSLVEDDCLEEINHKYVVKGRAYSVLEELERDDVRHADAARRNFFMLILTGVLAAAAIVQVVLC